jgi:hypothetical protein
MYARERLLAGERSTRSTSASTCAAASRGERRAIARAHPLECAGAQTRAAGPSSLRCTLSRNPLTSASRRALEPCLHSGCSTLNGASNVPEPARATPPIATTDIDAGAAAADRAGGAGGASIDEGCTGGCHGGCRGRCNGFGGVVARPRRPRRSGGGRVPRTDGGAGREPPVPASGSA